MATEYKYPRVSRAEELVATLLYVATDEERRILRNAKAPKTKLDDFWMNLGGDKEFARKMIKNFYRKIELANLYFTGYKEGWKTDQGMIFIIFGTPNEIYKQEGKEIWFYEKRNSIPTITFIFERKVGPLKKPIVELHHSGEYGPVWFQTVDLWRKGILEK